MTHKKDQKSHERAPRRACIVIPTTDGLVWLCGLKERSASLSSHMTLAGDFRQLAVSKEYHQFVSVPLKQIRDQETSVHIELSKPIDSGRSWEFPVLLAHILHQQDRLAFPDLKALAAGQDPGCDLVWATGKLNADLVPVGGDYSLAQKFCLSEDSFKTFQAHGRHIDMVLAEPLSKEILAKTNLLSSRFGLRFQAIKYFQNIDFLNIDALSPEQASNQSSVPMSKVPKHWMFALISFFSIIAASFAISSMMPEGEIVKTVQTDPAPVKQDAAQKARAITETQDTVMAKTEGSHIQTKTFAAKETAPKKTEAKAIPAQTIAKEAEAVVTTKEPLGKAAPKIAEKSEKPDEQADKTPSEQTEKQLPDTAEAAKNFVVKTLQADNRHSCRDAIANKQYCLENQRACASLGKDKVFQESILEKSTKQDYVVTAQNRNICGLRFQNTGTEPLTLVLDRKMLPFAFHGSNHLFAPLTLRTGQTIDLYLQRFPAQLQANIKINAAGNPASDLTLKF